MNNYQRLRDMREDHDKTQAEIAQLLGTDQSSYAKYEQGKNMMGINKYIILARYYNISLDYLVGLTDEPRTLDGRPFSVSKVSKNITINQTGNGQIHIKN